MTAAAVLLTTAFAGALSPIPTAEATPERGDRALARAADRYGVSEGALRERLAEHDGLRVTSSGAAYSIDPGPKAESESAQEVAQAFPLGDTFSLHSEAGSQRTIYLDFNGQDVSNTAWNSPSGGGVPNGPHPAMDLGGNGAAFSNAELILVQDIFQRVAEDYSPFDVDVTTEEPTAAELDRSDANDQVYGTRALITPSTSAAGAICNNQCGGVAFIGVFNHYAGLNADPTTHEQYQPAWVFPQELGNDTKNIAEAITHEVGHNLGLDHDATSTVGYYAGHDMWAPIMGVGYDRPVVQFALSDYPDADLGGPKPSLQANPDDLATINAFGAGFRTDEPGTSIGNAEAVPAGGGYIHNRADVDYFALGTCSGTVTVNANGAEVSPNLDIEVQLLNAGGTVLDSDNPASVYVTRDTASGMDATASASSLPAAQYYARIDGVGRGSATTSYTDYGSIGAYTLQVSGCAGGPVADPPTAPRDLTGVFLGIGEVTLSWSAPADNGGAAIANYRIYQDGTFLFQVAGSALGAGIVNAPSGVRNYGVSAVNSAGEGPQAHVTVDATDLRAKPGRPRIGDATPGRRGGKLTAKVRWQPPAGTTDPAINGYQVIAYKRNSNGRYVKVSTLPVVSGITRSATYAAGSRGKYKFAVKARNSLGFGPLSAKSNAVTPR